MSELTRYQGAVMPPMIAALLALGIVIEPIGRRKDGSPIWPIAGGAPAEGEIESVELSAEAIESIAAAVAAKQTPAEPEPVVPEPATKGIDLDALAAKIHALNTPNRTVLDEGGVKAKPGEPVYYGGEDKYTATGGTDAEIATNLFIAKTMVETSSPAGSRNRVSPRFREVMEGAAQKALAAAPDPIPTYAKSGYGGMKAVDPDRFIANGYAALRQEARAKAMTSTGTNAGDEWVPTFASSELWRDVHLETAVAAALDRVAMPTNPYTLPTLDADPVFKNASSENTAVTATDPNTGNATLTAVKLMAEIDFSTEVTEDSIIPIVPTLRATLVRRGAQTIDDLIVSGDTETGGTGNINSDDTAPVAGDSYLALNGMRKFCLVTNTGQVSNVAAALSTTNFLTIRGLLGRYGARPSDLRIVVGQSTLNTMYDIASVRTIDVYGPNATIVQGELARFFGIPILSYEAIPLLTSDKTAADGKADSATPTNNTSGWILLFNRNGWRLGFRRELVIESWRDIKKDQNVLVASFRIALIPSGIVTTHTAVGRNITV